MIIHKQSINYRDGNKHVIALPVYSEILSCDFQGEDLVFWYIFPDVYLNDLHERKLYTLRTGEPSAKFPHAPKFIGTAYDRNEQQPFVIHLFELT